IRDRDVTGVQTCALPISERREGQRAPEQSNAPASGEAAESGAEQGEDFLLHPTEEQGKKRRRKAVTPHWEDVLLGVRTNPKKKRSEERRVGQEGRRRWWR